MSKGIDLILSAVKSAGEAALRLHEENECLRGRLAQVIAYCAQEGHDGEPYDTFQALATGELDLCGSRPPEDAECCQYGECTGLPNCRKRLAALRELAQESQELGLYDVPPETPHV